MGKAINDKGGNGQCCTVEMALSVENNLLLFP